MKNKRTDVTYQTKEKTFSANDTLPHSASRTLAEIQNAPLPEGFHTISGPLRFRMTNDAMFHIVFEANHEALKGFLCSLLRLHPEEISSIEVTNPIKFGESVYSKTFVLDLRLLLNDTTVINIEMQVENLSFWKERSLAYLCRSFDSLNKGDSYLSIKPAIHIGILDFDLFPEHPEFYATYHLRNDVTHQKYSDNFRLSVLQLKHKDIATEEDRHWGLDLWAEFFRADSWEVIHMLAEKNPYIASAAQTVYRVSEDDYIRNMCEALEEGEKTQRTLELLHQMEKEKVEQLKQEQAQILQERTQILQERTQILQEQEQMRQELQQLRQKETQLAAALARIAELEANQK